MKSQDKAQKSEYYERDEVNLAPLFQLVSKTINGVRDRISYYFWLFKKKFIVLMYFVIIGVIFSLFNFYFASPTYKTSAIVVSNLLSNEYCSSLIQTLGELAKEKNYSELADKLNIEVSTAEKVKSIKFLHYTSAKSRKDTIIGEPFSIQVAVLDNQVLDSLQTGLIYYLENNVYALKRKSVKQATLNEFSAKMNSELTELDSLMKKIHHGILVKAVDDEYKILDPIETYKKFIDIYQEKYYMMERMALLSNFEVIEGFTKFQKPSSPRLIKDAVFAGFILFTIGFYIVLRDDKKKRKWYKASKWDNYNTELENSLSPKNEVV